METSNFNLMTDGEFQLLVASMDDEISALDLEISRLKKKNASLKETLLLSYSQEELDILIKKGMDESDQ